MWELTKDANREFRWGLEVVQKSSVLNIWTCLGVFLGAIANRCSRNTLRGKLGRGCVRFALHLQLHYFWLQSKGTDLGTRGQVHGPALLWIEGLWCCVTGPCVEGAGCNGARSYTSEPWLRRDHWLAPQPLHTCHGPTIMQKCSQRRPVQQGLRHRWTLICKLEFFCRRDKWMVRNP